MEKTIHILISYTMLVLMLLLFHRGRKNSRSLALALYALVEVVTNGIISFNMAAGSDFFDQFPFVHYIYKPIYCLWVPMFYFYVRHCFSSEFRIEKKNWTHFIPFFFFMILFLAIWIINGNQYIRENLYKHSVFLSQTTFAVDVMVKVQYLIYNFLMIRLLLNTERKLKDNPKVFLPLAVDIKWLRFIVYGYAVGCLTGIVCSAHFFFRGYVPSVLNMVSISYFFLFFFAIFFSTITHNSVPSEVKQKVQVEPSADLHLLMKKIDELMHVKQLFLEPELSLPDIAVRLNEKERNISQAVNAIKNRNVNDYINTYRIGHACRLLLADKDKPVFEVMYESGFGSKGAFNHAFKKVTGKTPTQFRED